MAGVVFGAILVGLIYLLAATMFRRRRIAVLAAIFVAVDGMSYVMSRIAMNDIFTATFIVAAYLLFWQVWSGRWKGSAWWALPLTGVFIGLAAASKWVGFYALAGLLILVLVRSPLGRLLLVGMIGFLLIVAGIDAPWPFLVVCAAAFAIAMLIVWRWPIRLRGEELLALPATGLVLGGIGLAFALAYGQIAGRQPKDAVETVFAFLARGAQASWPAWIMLAVTAVLILVRAGFSLRARNDSRWWAPEELGGFSWPWVGACLVIVPLAVYFVAYVPYLNLGHTIAIPNVGPGYAWSLDELHAQMFGYHFGLTAGHPSSSPWWSWPLDLKPTWFYGHSYDDRSTAAIYNGGNPILFWAGIPALVFAGIMAWRRRSLALVTRGRGVRVPVPALDADRAGDLHVPLLHRGPVRDGRARLCRRRAPRPARLAAVRHRIPQPGGGGRHHRLPARLSARDAGLVHQRGARAAAVELRVPVPRAAGGNAGAAREQQPAEARRRPGSCVGGRALRAAWTRHLGERAGPACLSGGGRRRR